MTSDRLSLTVAALGVLAVLEPHSWKYVTTHVITVAHEFGHALVAVLLGGRPTGVKLNRDSSGVTSWRAPKRMWRLRQAVTAWWGVPTPPLIGAGCVWAAATGNPQWAILGVAVMLLIVFILIRNLWGLLVVGVSMWLTWLAWNSGPEIVTAAAYGIGALLIVGGIRGGVEEFRSHLNPESDAGQLRRLLFLPSAFWSATMITATVVSAALAGWAVLVAQQAPPGTAS